MIPKINRKTIIALGLLSAALAIGSVGLTFKTLDSGDQMLEQTFAIIKPDAVKAGHTGKIIDLIEQNGFEILRMQKGQLTKEMGEIFYDVHKERPFFGELVSFIASGPVVVLALQKENAIADWRKLMGATNPKDAAPGTIRKLFGTSIGNNAVHGSDALETAMRELSLFFAAPAPEQARK